MSDNEFHSYVQPKLNKQLGDECRTETGIRQVQFCVFLSLCTAYLLFIQPFLFVLFQVALAALTSIAYPKPPNLINGKRDIVMTRHIEYCSRLS